MNIRLREDDDTFFENADDEWCFVNGETIPFQRRGLESNELKYCCPETFVCHFFNYLHVIYLVNQIDSFQYA